MVTINEEIPDDFVIEGEDNPVDCKKIKLEKSPKAESDKNENNINFINFEEL